VQGSRGRELEIIRRRPLPAAHDLLGRLVAAVPHEEDPVPVFAMVIRLALSQRRREHLVSSTVRSPSSK
jgi:hypothetical protein